MIKSNSLRLGPLATLVPIALFCMIVGGIAWALQFMPAWRGAEKTDAPAVASTEEFARYDWTAAVWDKDRPTYAMEYEMGADGFFDFPFQNVSQKSFELGLRKAACNCTSVAVTLLDSAQWDAYRQQLAKDPLTATAPQGLNWQSLQTELTNGLTVPVGGKGIVRMKWHARNQPPSRLNLKVDMWHRSNGEYQDVSLSVPAVTSEGIRFFPEHIDLGALMPKDKGTAEFLVWSPTRAGVSISTNGTKNPLVETQLSRLEDSEKEAWLQRLEKEVPTELTRLTTAYLLKVTVHEQLEDKYSDQGPFHYGIPLLVDGSAAEVKTIPFVQGIVKGDLQIGIPEDRGRLDLKEFSSKVGTRRILGIFTEAGVVLEYVSHDPATLKVTLAKDSSFQSTSRIKWVLNVEVPPNTQFGEFVEGSGIVLRIHSATPRLLRIPVVGIGTQG